MNAASLFDRLVGRYMMVALSFSLFPKIGPLPAPPHLGLTDQQILPVSTARASIAWERLGAAKSRTASIVFNGPQNWPYPPLPPPGSTGIPLGLVALWCSRLSR
jgi:hypothetical protein